MTTLLEEFRSNYSATQDEELGLEEYLELCKREPAAYASPAERMLAGIGEPELVDTRNDPAPWPDFRQPRHPALPGVQRVLRNGGRDRPDRRVLQARGAGARGEETDPLSAGTRWRRQVVDRRAAQSGDGSLPHLRDQGVAGQRIAARPVLPGALRRRSRGRLRHPAAVSHRHHVAVGDQAPAGIRRRSVAVPRRAYQPVGTAPGRDHQDRARRREQPGHLVAGRQGRHPPARASFAERSGRLQLFGRPVPGEPGAARIRRDVQGADQDAAPVADRDAGRQLQGHRRLFRDPVQRPHRRALERIRVAQLPQQQEQRGVPRPDLHRQGAVLHPRVRGSEDLRRSCWPTRRWPKRPARRVRSR